MKKYLFLLFLFCIYLSLINKKQVLPVSSYVSDETSSIKKVTLKFENGINSNDLISNFNEYQDYYFVQSIKLESGIINVKCDDLTECINDIYEEKNEDFNLMYVTNGFKIKEITYLIYNSENNFMVQDDL